MKFPLHTSYEFHQITPKLRVSHVFTILKMRDHAITLSYLPPSPPPPPPHTALSVAPTGVGETHLALNILEWEYFKHFYFIVIICTTLNHKETYKSRKWFWTDPHIIQMKPVNCLCDWIEKIGNLLAGYKTLFSIDDIIADETLDKRRNSLLDLAISGRHEGHSL